MKIDFANLQHEHRLYRKEIEEAVQNVMRHCDFIMGEEVSLLEEALQTFSGSQHAISCSSGTDALLLAMMALGIQRGDEIITTPFTFVATAETISLLGAKPVFVDIDAQNGNLDPSKIEPAITPKTKAIIPVSLYGQPADMDEIQAIANRHALKVILDGAQSFGSTYKGRTDSTCGDVACTSFFPAKPLGCYGDGGALFTNDTQLAEKLKSLRLHGQSKRYHHQYIGINGRLDTIQAAIVNVKLKHYPETLSRRETVASKYLEALSTKEVTLPVIKADRTSVWAQFAIRSSRRDALQQILTAHNIPTAIHYPKPLHLQEAFLGLGYRQNSFPVAEQLSKEVLCLPMNPYLTDEEIACIAQYIQ